MLETLALGLETIFFQFIQFITEDSIYKHNCNVAIFPSLMAF